MSKDPRPVWKTKETGRRRMMICQNSNPELSKYPQWGPADGAKCDEWAEVGEDTVALTCWRCAARSVRAIDNDRI